MNKLLSNPKTKKQIIQISILAFVIISLTIIGIIYALKPDNSTDSKYPDSESKITGTLNPSLTPTSTTALTSTPSPTTPKKSTPTPTKTPTSTPTPTPAPTTRPTISPMNKEVSRGPTTKAKIAITLDAGASATQTPQILQILKNNNLHFTFFLTGKWAEQNKDLVKQIIDNGNTIGNHTYDHKDLTTLTDAQIKEEFSKTEDIIKAISPTTAGKPYFRPPYGARNQHVWDYAASLGYQSIYWTVDAWDWKTDATADIVKTRIYNNAKNGAIVLMHVGDDITPAVLQEVITNLQGKGYSLVTLDDLLR